MSLSDSLELAVIDYMFGAIAYTPDATYYIGLSSTDPGETGSTQTEPSGSNYGRVAVTNNSTNFPTGNPKSLSTVVTFPTPSANWLAGVNLGFFTVWNHATNTAAANFRAYGAIANPNPALTGNIIRFNATQLTIQFT